MVVATERRQSGLMHRKIIDVPVLMEHFEIHNRTEGTPPHRGVVQLGLGGTLPLAGKP